MPRNTSSTSADSNPVIKTPPQQSLKELHDTGANQLPTPQSQCRPGDLLNKESLTITEFSIPSTPSSAPRTNRPETPRLQHLQCGVPATPQNPAIFQGEFKTPFSTLAEAGAWSKFSPTRALPHSGGSHGMTMTPVLPNEGAPRRIRGGPAYPTPCTGSSDFDALRLRSSPESPIKRLPTINTAGSTELELPPSSPIDRHMAADIHSTPPAAQSELPQSPSTPRAKPTCSDDEVETRDGFAYTVIDTPHQGRRIVFHNKELDPDSVIPFRAPVLIKEKTATPRKPIEVPVIMQRWLSAPSLPSTTETRKSKRLSKEREAKVKKRLAVFSEPPIRERYYEAVWDEVGRVLRPSQKDTLIAAHVQISQQHSFDDPFSQVQWPDAQFPWSIADREIEVDDGRRRGRELSLIERYLASETEDGSEGDEDTQMPWVEVDRIPEKRAPSKPKSDDTNQPAKVWVPTDPSDALTALLSQQAARRVALKAKALEQPRTYKPPERPKGKSEEEDFEEEDLLKVTVKVKAKSPEKRRLRDHVPFLEREQGKDKSPTLVLDVPMLLDGRSPTVSTSDGDKDADGEDVIACICKGGDDGRGMVQCDNCNTWHHLECVKKKPSEVRDRWYCWRCPEGEDPRIGLQPTFSIDTASTTSALALPSKKNNVPMYQGPALLQPSPIIEMSKRSTSSTLPTPQSLMAPFYPVAPSTAVPHKTPPSKTAPLAKPGAPLYTGPDLGLGTTPGVGPIVADTPGGYRPPSLDELAPIGVDGSPSRTFGLRFPPHYPGFNPVVHGTPSGRRDPIILPGVGLSGGSFPYYNAGRPWHNYPGPNFMTPQGPTRVQFAPYQAPQSTLPSVQTDPLFIHYEHDAPKTTAHHGGSVSGSTPTAPARPTRATRKKSKKSVGPGAESAEESRSGSIGEGVGAGSLASGDMELTTTPPSIVVPLASEDVKMEAGSTHADPHADPAHLSTTMNDPSNLQQEPPH